MRYFILFLSFSAMAVEIDPSVTTSKTLTCSMPTQYTDNTPLNQSDITEIRFYTSTNQTDWSLMGGGSECRYTVDTSALIDGSTTYYMARAVAGLESANSNIEVITAVIPKPPMPPILGWE